MPILSRTKEALHVHHLEYLSGCDPWDYPLDSLITVCESCHEYETTFRKSAEEKLIATLREVGFSTVHLDQLADAFGTAHFPCSKSEFAEFFEWFLTSSPLFEEALRKCYKTTLSSEIEDVEDGK
jgi:hypothetical protein